MEPTKIKKSEIVSIIKEEVENFKKVSALKEQLAKINKQLSEVYADGAMDAEKNDGVHAGQHKPVFQKKGSALIEDKEDDLSDIVSDEKEELKAALKTIGKALGLTGKIEFDGADGDETEVNAAAEETEEKEEKSTEEENTPEEEKVEDVEEVVAETEVTEEVVEETEKVEETVTPAEETSTLSEEAKRMKVLAGVKVL